VQAWRISPVHGFSASTLIPISTDELPTWFSPASKVTTSRVKMGE